MCKMGVTGHSTCNNKKQVIFKLFLQDKLTRHCMNFKVQGKNNIFLSSFCVPAESTHPFFPSFTAYLNDQV